MKKNDDSFPTNINELLKHLQPEEMREIINEDKQLTLYEKKIIHNYIKKNYPEDYRLKWRKPGAI